jgi:peptidyl-prolyl cis-trans isomerase C
MSDSTPTKNKTIGIIVAAVLAVIVVAGGFTLMGGKDKDATQTAASETSTTVAATQEAEDPNDPVVARVDGEPIKQSDVARFMASQSFGPGQDMDKIFPLALEQVIRGQVVINEAKSADLENDPEVQAQMEAAKRHIINTVFLQREVDTQITEAKLKKAYNEYVDKLPDVEERHARHILLKTEDEAKAAIKKIQDGAKFEDVAKAMSVGPTGPVGGDLGWFTKDRMVPEFAEAAFAMKKGEVSKEPVKSQFGYHVIKVEDVRDKPPFEDLKPQLTVQLRQEILNGLIDKWQKDAEIVRLTGEDEEIAPAAGEEEAAPATEEAPAAAEETPAESGEAAE